MLVITQDPDEETCPRTIQYHAEKTGYSVCHELGM